MKIPKHHYVPVFYLKQWALSKGRVSAFQRFHNDKVVATQKPPTHTGYDRGLYWLQGSDDDEAANTIETLVMGPVDHNAAIAHQYILRDDLKSIPGPIRDAWSRFLVGLLLRTPENITNAYEKMMNPTEREKGEIREILGAEPALEDLTPIEMKRVTLRVLVEMIRGTGVEDEISKMKWSIYNLRSSALEFFTSDRPVVMTRGIGRKGGHLVIPISPKKLFLAFADIDIEQEIKSRSAADLVGTVNNRIVRRAIKFAWSTSTKPLDFMQRHLGAEAADDLNFYASLE
ncbi:DUF4238 domain-containing protein [Bradyrhizobium sp. Pear77]|uniref:DUF4238 domain-containing protein n=1 Tax=Bradyrhizobium altum TaxID=1571202 RepID=UPI001E54AEB0|nr:DUF4238 domain-containing protein [Bradyrhizobium altum]MCC8954395.1 DUF4238 domain-containing protein [Bradyrhizobium altum]